MSYKKAKILLQKLLKYKVIVLLLNKLLEVLVSKVKKLNNSNIKEAD